ncbi:hypothetical protein [Luedemannella helvata]|uniref:Uncharacterized protein n=1 Tax=Luedemannella helvata TaxID=349315 RepID=A0ABN2KM92_9ACTN
MTARLREMMTEATDAAPAVSLAADTWRRGRRARHRARALGAAAALVVVVALTTALAAPVRTASTGPAEGGPAVPARLDLPWMWQATVQQDPPGPAAVLFGGDASYRLHGADLFDSEGKLAVVGRGGDYRMLLYAGVETITAGEDVQLSPDGTRVAHDFVVTPELPDSAGGLVITDLATGASTVFPNPAGGGACCTPVAWAPDGGSLLARQYTDGHGAARLVLVNLADGTSRPITGYGPTAPLRTASAGAFAPDGQRFVVAEGTKVRLADRANGTLWTADLGPRRYLAGVGAFTPDGALITTVTLDGCLDDCDEAALAARRWTFGYLDARTGADAAGPALPPVTGLAVRALGWSRGTELVALRYAPETGAHKPSTDPWWNDTGWEQTGHVMLLGLAPGGATRTLLDPPDGVLNMDIPRDLIEAGAFGGPSSSASIFPARPIIWVAVVPLGFLLVGAGLVGWLTFIVVRRRRRAPAR